MKMKTKKENKGGERRMKKLTLILAVVCLSLLVGGNVWAASFTLTVSDLLAIDNVDS